MLGRGPGHRTIWDWTFLGVWESASLVKTRQGASRQERRLSLLSAGFECGIQTLIVGRCDSLRSIARTHFDVWEGLDVRTVGVSFNGVRVGLGEFR